MPVVLDTNILVSALLSPFGPPARILDLVLAGEIQPAFDDRIIAEYREVLARPRFAFDAAKVADLLELFEHHGRRLVARPLGRELPDPDALPFLEVAAQAGATLVTGNPAHFPTAMRGDVEVLAPAEFLRRYLGRGQ